MEPVARLSDDDSNQNLRQASLQSAALLSQLFEFAEPLASRSLIADTQKLCEALDSLSSLQPAANFSRDRRCNVHRACRTVERALARQIAGATDSGGASLLCSNPWADAPEIMVTASLLALCRAQLAAVPLQSLQISSRDTASLSNQIQISLQFALTAPTQEGRLLNRDGMFFFHNFLIGIGGSHRFSVDGLNVRHDVLLPKAANSAATPYPYIHSETESYMETK